MRRGGAASTFVTAGAAEDMVESIEDVGSAIGVGLGFWRFGRGELGGEVADIAVVERFRIGKKSCKGRRDARGSRRPLNGLEFTHYAYFKAWYLNTQYQRWVLTSTSLGFHNVFLSTNLFYLPNILPLNFAKRLLLLSPPTLSSYSLLQSSSILFRLGAVGDSGNVAPFQMDRGLS